MMAPWIHFHFWLLAFVFVLLFSCTWRSMCSLLLFLPYCCGAANYYVDSVEENSTGTLRHKSFIQFISIADATWITLRIILCAITFIMLCHLWESFGKCLFIRNTKMAKLKGVSDLALTTWRRDISHIPYPNHMPFLHDRIKYESRVCEIRDQNCIQSFPELGPCLCSIACDFIADAVKRFFDSYCDYLMILIV